MYPLRFHPIFKDYLWGGQRLAEVLGKATGPGVWAESWEIVDHVNGQSVVEFGEFSGQTLSELIASHGTALLGQQVYDRITNERVPEQLRGRFPLLLKFLDANRDLSVQVHPDDTIGATLKTPDFGKTEAWYIVDAQPKAKIYAGLKTGVTAEDFRDAIEQGKAAEVLHSFSASAGDCVFIRAGTVHAIGAGLMVCEIQQASDTTFRLFDWNRVDDQGNSRPLHIEQGIAATDFSIGPVQPQQPEQETDSNNQQLVKCDKFHLNRVQIDGTSQIGGDGKFHIVAVVNGEIEIENDPSGKAMTIGSSALIPADSKSLEIKTGTSATILEISLP